jgi:type I restriction enzyme M protein
VRNRLGRREALPAQYGAAPQYAHIAGWPGDVEPAPARRLEAAIRSAHAKIWAGGKRDPLFAFDEWSKLLFAKVADERTTPTGEPRRFQCGSNETSAAVANRVHRLFAQACATDPAVFPVETRLDLPDSKIADVVVLLQALSFTRTDIDSIGQAFEQFFGSVFRGELGQYFTMRQLARFTVAMLDIDHDDYVLDPTAGSGGFLLEVLLQTWHRVDREFRGQPNASVERLKYDFAGQHVFGIEIHSVLARICKINLLLHHDGHSNIEADRSCLDVVFRNGRLTPFTGRFSRVVGNPPFGDEVKAGDEDLLGNNQLENFAVAEGRPKVDSEHVIVERCVEMLEPGGWFGLILPDGFFNNQGENSNCPRMRSFLARRGRMRAIVSLPDHAFRKSGAQNKTSILFFEKFSAVEQLSFDHAYENARLQETAEDEAVAVALTAAQLDYHVFLAEANHIGYLPTGTVCAANELYRGSAGGMLEDDQSGTILGEWRRFLSAPESYEGARVPDCLAAPFTTVWRAHPSRRLDPKFHLFQREAERAVPPGWVRLPVRALMRRREEVLNVLAFPERIFTVLTIAQTGELRARAAGKGRNPPEWQGAYFLESSSQWFAARAGDLVFSSIDLWKGCVAVVPPEFDQSLVTKEFPIYEITDARLDPAFVQCLLRSRYYQRAFRAITTGHSNRRRTQIDDFESLDIIFPPDRREQERLIAPIQQARQRIRQAQDDLRHEWFAFSDVLDGRGAQELPLVEESAGQPED